jgi:transposase-like protein
MLVPIAARCRGRRSKMDTKHEELTAVEHVERAQGQGQTVAEYCRQAGLSPHALYSARRQLRKREHCRDRPNGARLGGNRGSSSR